MASAPVGPDKIAAVFSRQAVPAIALQHVPPKD
jgi:hypothetical protein